MVRVEREVGGGIGMGKTCKLKDVSFQCMTKFTSFLIEKYKIGWIYIFHLFVLITFIFPLFLNVFSWSSRFSPDLDMSIFTSCCLFVLFVVLVIQSCPTLATLWNVAHQGLIHRFFQARILEWVAISSSSIYFLVLYKFSKLKIHCSSAQEVFHLFIEYCFCFISSSVFSRNAKEGATHLLFRNRWWSPLLSKRLILEKHNLSEQSRAGTLYMISGNMGLRIKTLLKK